MTDITSIRTFFRLSTLNLLEDPLLFKWASLWNNNSLPNNFREFIFKYNNNILPINTRLSHFADNQVRSCTFCTLANVNPPVDEDFYHLFYNCPTTKKFHTEFKTKFLSELNLTPNDWKKLIFTGTGTDDLNYNTFLAISILYLQFCIWTKKLRKKIPSFRTLMVDFFDTLNGILTYSPFLHIEKNRLINITLFRDWDAHHRQHGAG